MPKSVFHKTLNLFVAGFICIACSSTRQNNTGNTEMKETSQTSQTDFDKQGHRGCRGLMPENTVPAMINAVGLGVTTLEMDVVITKDKQVILSHEPFFNHEITTKPDGGFITSKDERTYNIYQMDYAAIVKYDVGLKPHPRFPKQEKMKAAKPRLADVFDSVNNYMMMARRPFPYYNIETKTNPATDNTYHPAPAEFVELLMKVIKEKQMEEQVIIQSFDFRTLQYLHQKYPQIKTTMLIEDFDTRTFEQQLKALGFTPTIYSPAYKLVTKELIEKCHLQNIRIIPWTVNTKTEIEKYKSMGVDGIITDYPDLFN